MRLAVDVGVGVGVGDKVASVVDVDVLVRALGLGDTELSGEGRLGGETVTGGLLDGATRCAGVHRGSVERSQLRWRCTWAESRVSCSCTPASPLATRPPPRRDGF